MSSDEIEIPKELRPFMLDNAKLTSLGQKNGATKQYRYGNLHIREYDDKFLVHMDKIDPTKNPLGHLIVDAPEVLIGLVLASVGGAKVGSYLFKNRKKSRRTSILAGFLASLAFGYLGHSITKSIKNF